ncbi:cupredoxin domain-containing protein [Patescibacteria group bacterium]|nr:cupredoxin domain-containing protein [Patescibacteria group bacterium]
MSEELKNQEGFDQVVGQAQAQTELQNQNNEEPKIQNNEPAQAQAPIQTQRQTSTQVQNQDKKLKLIIKIVVLIILLGLGTWLAIFFLNDDSEEDILNNLNLGDNKNISGSNTDYNNKNSDAGSKDISLDGPASETETSGSRPITVVPDDYRMSLEAPEQSVVVKLEDVPAGAISIIGTDDGFEPNEFFVEPGQEFTLTLTAQSASPVVLTFYDPTMAAVAIGCGPGDTRYVTFTAPTKSGEYVFVNDVFGKREQTGKMIVR